MKTGKFINLGEYKNIKLGYGTVDYKNLKTVYLKFNSWLQPNDEDEDFNEILNFSKRKIKTHINTLNSKRFEQPCIVDLDVRTKGIKLNKRSFMNLEVTLYVKEYFDIKNKTIKEDLKRLMTHIVDETLDNNQLYNFNKTKN
jgi:hypothetical protein